MRHRLWFTPALILLGLLTACSNEPPAADFNDADVTFATQMIPHHQQAVQMAGMAGYTATNPELKKLATVIQAAQDPEINTLTTWLTARGKPVPTPAHGEHASHDLPGMMSEDDMSALGNAKGAQFDRQWTKLMIAHHQGALTMATTEQSTGKNPEALALATKIHADQTREITTLQHLLTQLPPT